MKDSHPTDVRAALATLVSTEPDLPTGSADIERRGRRLRFQRRMTAGAGGALVLVAAGLGALQLTGEQTGTTTAQPPASSSTDSGGSQLASGFPVGSAVDAVAAALPASFAVADLPMDIGWRAGGLLEVPIGFGPVTGTPPAPTHVITIEVSNGTCSATVTPSDALTQAELDAIATAVCAEWVATGSPRVIPGAAGEENPDLATS